LLDFAAKAGVDPAPIATAIENGRFTNWVTASTEQASKDGLQGTPWVKINGTTLVDWSPDKFTAAIDKALAG
jgi:2-hydroxychromene-2-carboxylate isomerase